MVATAVDAVVAGERSVKSALEVIFSCHSVQGRTASATMHSARTRGRVGKRGKRRGSLAQGDGGVSNHL